MYYQPKGTMCAACIHKDRDCRGLPFATMKVLEVLPNGLKVVKCTDFIQAAPAQQKEPAK